MARPSYLARRGDGRYFLQIRLGKQATKLYGHPLLRVSLRTGDFQEARRRLMDNLVWVQELIHAPDLETAGVILSKRLGAYVSRGTPQDDRQLAERCAFEHEVRRYLTRVQERGYAYAKRFPEMPNLWGDFVEQNKTAETSIAKINQRRAYESGRADALEATAEGWNSAPQKQVAETKLDSFDPIGLIERLVQDAVAQRIMLPEVTTAPSLPAIPKFEGELTADASPVNTRMSDALQAFMQSPDRKRAHKMKGRGEATAVVQFAIDFLGDPSMNDIKPKDWQRLDEALPDIPHPKNIPGNLTLFERYQHAQAHGWDNLTRLTEATIKKRYWPGLKKFVEWSIENGFYRGKQPKFECIDCDNQTSLPRDAFEDEELLKLLGLPLFTGCRNKHHIWTPGNCFVQSHIYWGYLIAIFTGMRPGEIGQLKCADIKTDGTFYYFDLRPFDARAGRVALKDLRNLKTNAAARVVPINPLLIELGLLDRLQEIMDKGIEEFLPEWEPYDRTDGTTRWSQPLSKSWQYVKKVLKSTRKDLTLYSTRHLMADWLDSEAIAQRTRDRILGHASDVRGRYGRKGILDPQIAAQIEALEPPVVKAARAFLLAAKARADHGELTPLKTF